MTGELLRAASRSLPTRALTLHLIAALVLLAVTARGLQDSGAALQALRGLAVLLAAALALSVDEPGPELLDSLPTSLAQRAAGRLAVCLAVVLPVWLLALGATALRGADLPLTAVTLELAALAVAGLAIALCLRRWWRLAEPALVTAPLLIALLLVSEALPRRMTLLEDQFWGPPWQAAHLRWSALLLAAAAVLLAALADPATARTGRR